MRAYGFTWEECEALLGYNWSALRRAALREGAKVNYQPVCKEALARARELRATGLPWKVIGREVGQNYRTLKNYISRQNQGG